MKRAIDWLTRDTFSVLFLAVALIVSGITDHWWWLTQIAAFAGAAFGALIVSDVLRWAVGLPGITRRRKERAP